MRQRYVPWGAVAGGEAVGASLLRMVQPGGGLALRSPGVRAAVQYARRPWKIAVGTSWEASQLSLLWRVRYLWSSVAGGFKTC